MRRELDAAGITEPMLRASYERCRRLNAAHGKTYYLATLLLPARKRPHVHALYGFARFADEIVDDLGSTSTGAERAARLDDWGKRFLAGESDDAVLPAVQHTIATYDIPREHFDDFLDSMAMDLTVDHYDTFDDLMGYMHGSAAVIGLQMLPVLGTVGSRRMRRPMPPTSASRSSSPTSCAMSAKTSAAAGSTCRGGRRALRGRRRAAARGHRGRVVPAALAFEIARTREIYRRAALGIPLLDPTCRDCIRAAMRLYGGILDEIEKADYQVLGDRVVVPRRTRVAVALPRLAGALIARSRGR